MWSSDRRLFLAGLLALGACGFAPVYGPGGQAQGLKGAIEVAAPEDGDAYQLVKRLEERLGRPRGAPRYRLEYTLKLTPQDAGVTAAGEIARTQLAGQLKYQLIGPDGQVVASGQVSDFTSYSNEGSTVSTASVERDARRRLMVALADLLVTRLIATAPDWLE